MAPFDWKFLQIGTLRAKDPRKNVFVFQMPVIRVVLLHKRVFVQSFLSRSVYILKPTHVLSILFRFLGIALVIMKLSAVVALFLIGAIPEKFSHVYSQTELHWGAKGSGRPPKITQLLDKVPSSNLAGKLPILNSDISEIDRHHLEDSGKFHGSDENINTRK